MYRNFTDVSRQVSQDELEQIRAIDMRLLLECYQIQIERSGSTFSCLCPFHAERSPSCVIYRDHVYCFACGTYADQISFVQERESIEFFQACQQLAHQFGITLSGEAEETNDERREREERQCKRAQELRARREEQERQEQENRRLRRRMWPKLYKGQTHDLEELARLRGIHYAGPWLAQELGHLRFTVWRRHLAWIVGDKRAATARRLDGLEWEHGTPHKSDTMPASERHPIGLTRSSLPVITVEGEPDYLSTLARLWELGESGNHEVVAMLGSGTRFGSHAAKLKGRDLVIYAHTDKSGAGMKAAKRWKKEAELAGAASIFICPLPEGQDINDLTNLAA